jgi:predicted HicB family RNase H-like nuclease
VNRPLKYRGHTGSVETSVEDNCLFGRVLYIDSLVSYEGQTEEAIEAAFREAVDDFLERARTGASSAQPPNPQHR